MSAYCIFDMTQVIDGNKMEEYREQVGATIEQYEGRYVAKGGDFEVVEGNWQPTRIVMLEFPTLEQARQWYNSEAYGPLKTIRLEASRSNGVIFDGVS